MNGSFELLKAMAGVPRERQAALAEIGVLEGRWTAEEAASYFDVPDREPVARERRPRRPTVTRRMRLSERRCAFSRYVRRFSTDVLTHPFLSTGSITTLVYLISRCGRRRTVSFCTSWLAADLGVTKRTIQNHLGLIERAGFIVRSAPDRLGRTTVYLTELVEVAPPRKSEPQTVAGHGNGEKKASPTEVTDSLEEVDEPPLPEAKPDMSGTPNRIGSRGGASGGIGCRREKAGTFVPRGRTVPDRQSPTKERPCPREAGNRSGADSGQRDGAVRSR